MRVCDYWKTCALVIGLTWATSAAAYAQSPSGPEGCPTSEHCTRDSDCNDGDYCQGGDCMSVDACDVPIPVPEVEVPVDEGSASSSVDEGAGCDGSDSGAGGCEGGGGGGDCSISRTPGKHRGGGYGTGALLLAVLLVLRVNGWRRLSHASR